MASLLDISYYSNWSITEHFATLRAIKKYVLNKLGLSWAKFSSAQTSCIANMLTYGHVKHVDHVNHVEDVNNVGKH